MARYSIETYGELEPHLAQEWLLTNGMGSFASGTVVGCNTRRYHGLLCAATVPPVGRMMMLNRVAETLTPADAGPIDLSVNVFEAGIMPRGDQYLRRFELDESVRWEYETDGIRLSKELVLVWQRNTSVLRYRIDPGNRTVELTLTPFVSMRDFHVLRTKASDDLTTREIPRGVAISEGDATLNIRCDLIGDGAEFRAEPDWWLKHKYPVEEERGLDFLEDLFKPGRFVLTVKKPTTLLLWGSTESIDGIDFDGEVARHAAAMALSSNEKKPGMAAAVTDKQIHLARAAEDFIVARKRPDGGDGLTIIAGYPWFADWGRDTMIALPGLLLTSGRFDEALGVLSVFAAYESEGMIPNRFDDYSNQPHYNTVDASLWFIQAANEYARLSGDRAGYEKQLRPACEAILDGYRRGTRFNIKMDEADGLINQGDANTQLTWMDAKCGNIAFTPRQGKAVEINALWYHALRLCGRNELADRVAASFSKAFWINPYRGLADVVNDGNRDTSMRPNQIFAVSLEHSPLSSDQQRAVVEVVRRELLTPFGLRTLGPNERGYSPLFRGDQFHRDQAYHNGTIWPWLIGPFLWAYLRVNKRSQPAIEQARQWLTPLIESMGNTGCIGQIAEIFEAQPPHRPVGCFAQAWSVSEVLRIANELQM
jgi:predicted glycogen debranching enzyme